MNKDFLELAEARYSVRKYSDKPVEQDRLDRILRAGQVAPTAANSQPQQVYVLRSAEALAKVRGLTRFHFNAPMVLLVCSDGNRSHRISDGHDCGPIDAAIVTCHMMLEAADLGLGTCWVRGFNQFDVAEAFGLPEGVEPVAMLLLGYPAADSHPWPGAHDKRLPIEETVTYL
ncbi:MAG: nitroreductase family protein [Actinomycetota bacterium]|nr:nitroreductase family protein [Actinomycetota bacterium]